MKRKPVSQLTPGDELGTEVKINSPHPNVQYKLRLAAGTKLTKKQIKRLQKLNIKAVPVDSVETKDLDGYVHDEEVNKAEEKVKQSFQDFKNKLNNNKLSKESINNLQNTINDLVEALQNTELMAAYTNLKTHDNYTAQHSLDVTKISLQIVIENKNYFRKKLKKESGASTKYINRHMLQDLGLGAMLHDVGKSKIDTSILNKNDQLTQEEWEQMENHSQTGYNILNELRHELNLPVMAPAREHHEKFDGSGYPQGLKGQEIHIFGRLTACTDVYSALTSNRPYRDPMTPVKAIDVMNEMQDDGPHFDPEIFEKFKTVVFPYPVGSEVQLSDGRRGVVCDVDSNNPRQPIVRLLDAGKEIKIPNRPGKLEIIEPGSKNTGVIR